MEFTAYDQWGVELGKELALAARIAGKRYVQGKDARPWPLFCGP